MPIPAISISLDKIYKPSANHQDLETIKKWCERVVLPEVLLALELFFVGKSVESFGSLSDACNALVDPLLALAFTPVDHQHLHLTPAQLH